MDVYLVRHGQTDGNVGRRHQHPDTSLNELGRAQAIVAADTIAALKPSHLITSTQVRALETARVIASVTDLIPTDNSLFEELHQPASMQGVRQIGLHAFGHAVFWFLGVRSATMHDGETYEAFVERLAGARTYLEALPTDSRVVIVSHSVFVNFFVEHMRHPKRMNVVRAAICFLNVIRLKNTSITHVRYEKPPTGFSDTGWHLVRGK